MEIESTGTHNGSRIKSLNIDLKLIKEYSHPIVQQRICAPKNIRELGNLLKEKNQKAMRTKEDRERGQIWLRGKQVDLEPLFEKVKTVKELNHKNKQQRVIQHDSTFYMPQLNIDNQEDYLAKANQLGTLTIMQSMMASRSSQKRFNQNLMAMLSHNPNQKKKMKIKSISSKPRSDPQKRNNYIECMKRILHLDDKRLPLIKCFQESMKTEFWDIMYKQVKDVDYSGVRVPVYLHFLLNSLKTVESIFDANTPKDKESLHYYLNTEYLFKLERQPYIRDHESGALWGKAFLLYRAGRKQQLRAVLEHQKGPLQAEFMRVDESIKDRNPQISALQFDTGQDVFLDQLIYALKGESKYSTPVICNPESLDVVWVILRCIAIFSDGRSEKFLQFRDQLMKSYKSPQSNTVLLLNMFHLLAYQQLILLGPNQLMDRYDYLHFLIALYYNPELARPNEVLKGLLVENLITFIYELQSEKRDQYLYYMVMLPDEAKTAEISTLLAANSEWKEEEWKFLKKHIAKDIYDQLMEQTLEKHVLKHQNYLLAARKSYQILKKPTKSIHYLLDFLIKSAVKLRANQNDLMQAEDLFRHILKEDDQLKRIHERTFSLLQLNRKLTLIRINRNEGRIAEFIYENDYVVNSLLQGALHETNRKMLLQLKNHRGIEVYFCFLQNIIMAAQKSYTTSVMKLKNFYQDVASSMKEVLDREQFCEYKELPTVKNLGEFLNVSLRQMNK